MRPTLLIALAILALAAAVAWNAGEQHRENCIRDGRVSCSALPWDYGRPPRVVEPASACDPGPAYDSVDCALEKLDQ